MKSGYRAFRALALTSICVVALVLASCGGAGDGRQRDSQGKIIPNIGDLDPAGTLYSNTISQADAGNCSPDNVSVLTCFSYRGHGYEGAQTSLGQCLLRGGKTDEGLTWLKRAANAGWPDAQKLLARIYLEGKLTGQDNVEAATWNSLYLRNPSLLSLGVRPEGDISEKLKPVMSAQERSTADQRVRTWVPSYWEPKQALNAETARSCRVRTKHKGPDKDAVDSALNPTPTNSGGGY